MTIAVRDPALHILVFAPIGPNATDPDGGLARTWEATSRLGITEPATGFDQHVELPAELPDDDVWFRVIAAKSDPGGRDTAIAFTAHDVAAVVVRLRTKATISDGDAWAALSTAWHDAAGDAGLDGIFGAAHVFTGVSDGPSVTLSGDEADTARKVLAGHAGSGLETSAVVDPGITLWDMEMLSGRAVVALAGNEAAALLGEWCWVSATNDDIGQLVRYYMHASKLRFEIGVFRSGIDELRDRERELDAGLAELFTLHERFETTAAGARELIDAQSRLGRAQGDAAGLLVSITYLRDLGQTVEIAIHNLREYEPEKAVDAPAAMSPFGRDLRLAKWLADRVGHEIAYLESCRERVGEAQALTDLRLKQLAASHARTAEWLTVLQTSLVASLLGAFAVSSALGEPFPAPWHLRVSVMALVAALALVLPPLALRWNHGYAWPELTAAAVVGAAAGCVTVAGVVSTRQPDELPPTEIMVVWWVGAAALGAALFAGAAYLANRQR